jgi:hypothetical protein
MPPPISPANKSALNKSLFIILLPPSLKVYNFGNKKTKFLNFKKIQQNKKILK